MVITFDKAMSRIYRILTGLDDTFTTNITDSLEALTIQNGSSTDQEFSPTLPCVGFSSVKLLGDANLIPSNIIAGVTIYGVTGTASSSELTPLSVSGSTYNVSGETISPSAPYTGYSSVTLPAQPDLVASNIVQGATIFGVEGTAEIGSHQHYMLCVRNIGGHSFTVGTVYETLVNISKTNSTCILGIESSASVKSTGKVTIGYAKCIHWECNQAVFDLYADSNCTTFFSYDVDLARSAAATIFYASSNPAGLEANAVDLYLKDNSNNEYYCMMQTVSATCKGDNKVWTPQSFGPVVLMQTSNASSTSNFKGVFLYDVVTEKSNSIQF